MAFGRHSLTLVLCWLLGACLMTAVASNSHVDLCGPVNRDDMDIVLKNPASPEGISRVEAHVGNAPNPIDSSIIVASVQPLGSDEPKKSIGMECNFAPANSGSPCGGVTTCDLELTAPMLNAFIDQTQNMIAFVLRATLSMCPEVVDKVKAVSSVRCVALTSVNFNITAFREVGDNFTFSIAPRSGSDFRATLGTKVTKTSGDVHVVGDYYSSTVGFVQSGVTLTPAGTNVTLNYYDAEGVSQARELVWQEGRAVGFGVPMGFAVIQNEDLLTSDFSTYLSLPATQNGGPLFDTFPITLVISYVTTAVVQGQQRRGQYNPSGDELADVGKGSTSISIVADKSDKALTDNRGITLAPPEGLACSDATSATTLLSVAVGLQASNFLLNIISTTCTYFSLSTLMRHVMKGITWGSRTPQA